MKTGSVDKGEVCYLSAKVYFTKKLVASFPGVDVKLLPLFATLTGNDFMEKSCFQKFYGEYCLVPTYVLT